MGNIITDLFSSGAGKLIQGLGTGFSEVVSKFKADPTKVIELESDLEKLKIQTSFDLQKLNSDIEQAYLKDMDSARNMQIEALKQTDVFSKRFIYYLASLVIILVFIYDFCLFKIDYPEKNRDLVNMIAGILNSTALVMILSFFFGSSMGSKKAGETIEKIMNK